MSLCVHMCATTNDKCWWNDFRYAAELSAIIHAAVARDSRANFAVRGKIGHDQPHFSGGYSPTKEFALQTRSLKFNALHTSAF